MDPRTAKTRQALLDAAEELFAERGFAAVGNRELVACAGVNLAAIQYHFGSKLELYLETVRRAVQRPQIQAPWNALCESAPTRLGAARALARFVRQLTASLLSKSELNACARLMLREAMHPSDALPDVVRSFTRPHEDLLASVIARIVPGAPPEETRLAARGVLGQVFHHHLFRPFFQERPDESYGPAALAAIADYIVRFSLRGLGCSPRLIARALAPEDVQRSHP